MNWIEASSSGIIAILTLALTKLFDNSSKKREQNFQFKKLFFERKLNAGEFIIGQLSFLYPSIVGLSSLLKGLLELESDAGLKYNQTLFANLSSKLTEYQNKIENLSQPTILYFNVEDILLQTSFFSEWQILIEEFGKMAEKHQQLNEQYLAYPTDELDIASELAFKEMQNHIKLIACTLDKLAVNILEAIGRIKTELTSLA